MRFCIDTTTSTISGTCGNSGLIQFSFDKVMNGSVAGFFVKKYINDVSNAIEIEYEFPATSAEPTSSFILEILPEHTNTLNPSQYIETCNNVRYVDYIYGLKIFNYGGNDGTTQTVLPYNTYAYPKFRMYLDANPSSTHSLDTSGADLLFVYTDNYPIITISDISVQENPENQKSIYERVIQIYDM